MIFLFGLLSFLLSVQISLRSFELLFERINYKVGIPQILSYLCAGICFCFIIFDFVNEKFWTVLLGCILSFLYVLTGEFILAKINTYSKLITIGYRLLLLGLVGLVLFYEDVTLFTPFIIMGLWISNTPLGTLHPKDMKFMNSLARVTPVIKSEEVVVSKNEIPFNFSNVGCKREIKGNLRLFNVLDYGIKPNCHIDQTDSVNQLIDTVGKQGGGVVFFPKGKYFFNCDKSSINFIKINHNNIVIEGEVSNNRKCLTELVNCNKTVSGVKNPWLSPFFITTGESIQQSNWFWGLQFRKWDKSQTTKSDSVSDPGSDGSILEPEYVTSVTVSAKKGETILVVEDTGKLSKYILIGLYNTDERGSLIRDILGVDIRPEWKTPLRAGTEQAPSFQWLVEIDQVIDKHRFSITQPLWRDCLMEFEPKIYNVELLENIVIRNLVITSRWNGLFRHHGLKGYYSIGQTQEMDYGWNAINMKRVAHSIVDNVYINNFTNPMYLLDCRNVTVSNVIIDGYDGHQGIKIYGHSCDNLLKNITFRNHFADMMGGEGNAYGNVFSNVRYLNPEYKPCDYDFHGFSEGPMSPPAYNLFDNIYGFRYIKMAGALYNQPACAQWNIWWNCVSEGEKKGDYIFYAYHYRSKIGLMKKFLFIAKAAKRKKPSQIIKIYKEQLSKANSRCMPKEQLCSLFKNIIIYGNKSLFVSQNNDNVKMIDSNKDCLPTSLIDN